MEEMLAGGGGSGNGEGAYILKEYVQSWQAYRSINDVLNIDRMFSNGDFVSRYGGASSLFRQNDVALWHYFQSMANADVDEKSGILRLSARAFTAEDAHRLANELLEHAVQRMDQMNSAQERDAASIALARKQQMAQALAKDEADLAAYRAREGIFDPDVRYGADVQLASGLALQESQLAAQQSAGKQTMAANPNVEALDASIGAIRKRMEQTRQDAPTLARKAAKYNQLVIQRENDAALLKAASLAVQETELKATEGRYYLSVISAPSSPVHPQLPNRLQWVAAIFAITLLLWGLLR